MPENAPGITDLHVMVLPTTERGSQARRSTAVAVLPFTTSRDFTRATRDAFTAVTSVEGGETNR